MSIATRAIVAASTSCMRDLSHAVVSTSGRDRPQRANALEVIENVGARDIVKPLLLMWDATPSALDQDTLFERLRQDPDDWIRACVDLATSAPRPRFTKPEEARCHAR